MTDPRPDPVAAARSLVATRFPTARQAWLGGSVAGGTATATSDLDLTVLLDETEVGRESLTHEGWPVELFVHTDASVRFFTAKDLERRRPTMARLVAEAIPLLPGDGGSALRAHCAGVLVAGPPRLDDADLDALRYHLTDQLDDLLAVEPGGPRAPGDLVVDLAVVVEVWRLTAELLLAAAPWWHGGGKWLAREVKALDDRRGTHHAQRLAVALAAAVAGSPGLLVAHSEEVLDAAGGRLRDGYRQAADLP